MSFGGEALGDQEKFLDINSNDGEVSVSEPIADTESQSTLKPLVWLEDVWLSFIYIISDLFFQDIILLSLR